jgi:transcriptional regulator with XRE-family HTH domain
MNEAALKSVISIIGDILKLFREKTGKHQSDIASKAGISVSMLSQIERGMVSPSIDTLLNVCNALELDAAELFRRIAPEPAVRIQKKGQRLYTDRDGVLFEQLAVSVQKNMPAEMLLLEVEHDKRVGLSNSGHEGLEMGYVLEGSAIMVIEGTEYELNRGDSVSFNASLPHSLINVSKKPFRAIWTAMPPHKDYLE